MKAFPSTGQFRERLVAAALLTPAIFFLFLWGLFFSQSINRIDLAQVLRKMLGTAFVSSYCATLFVMQVRASGSNRT
jgi:hypothetical protein